MFQNYVKKTLELNEYFKIMKDCPVGYKYCNAFCQAYLLEDEFYDRRACCKACFNQITKAKNMIDNNQLTAEQFKENPSLVIREKTVIPVYKKCKTCSIEKTLEKYEPRRLECIECRRGKAKKNHQEDFDKQLPAIEAVKGDIAALTTVIRNMSADVVKLAIAHYQITRHPSDRKDNMVLKLIDHFKSLLNPFICLGNCGCTLPVEFSVCDVCKKLPKNSYEEMMFEFEKNLDEHVSNLTSMKKDVSHLYNKKQIVMIANKLGIKYYQTMDKPIIMELIDKYFTDKKAEEEKIICQNKSQLVYEGFSINSREDGFLNATEMCKAFGKLFADWFRLESTKELISTLEDQLTEENLIMGIPIIENNDIVNPISKNNDMGIPIIENNDIVNPISKNNDMGIPISKNNDMGIFVSKTVDIKKGGNKFLQGAWIHPDLAVQLAQWLDKKFAIKVSRWTRELATTGSVTVGSTKTNQQLLELQQSYKKLEDKHRKLLERKTYHKFMKGPSFYIISDLDGKSVKFKPGFEGVDIDVRMEQHRSTMPTCQLEYLIYSDDAKLVEQSILKRYENKRRFVNHEWVYDVDVKHIINSTRTILDILNIKYTEESNIQKYNNQIETDFS